jgi:ABC-type polysaccharide/polyol phosphate export permease
MPLKLHSQKLTVTSYSIFVGLAVVVVFCAISWVAAPKGDTQTYVFLPYVPLRDACCILISSFLAGVMHRVEARDEFGETG